MSGQIPVPDVSAGVDDLLRKLGVDSASRAKVGGFVKDAQADGDYPGDEDFPSEELDRSDPDEEDSPPPRSTYRDYGDTSRDNDGRDFKEFAPGGRVNPDGPTWQKKRHFSDDSLEDHGGDAVDGGAGAPDYGPPPQGTVDREIAGGSGGWDQPGVRDAFERVERDIGATSGRGGEAPSRGNLSTESGDDVRGILASLGHLDS